MRCSETDDKTEQQFMQVLWNRTSQCCGPLVYLTLRSPGVDELLAAMGEFECEEILHDAKQADGSYVMCAAHWYDVCMLVGGAGEARKNPRWKSLKAALFVMVSKEAGWDHREMFNRFASFFKAKTGGYDSLGV